MKLIARAGCIASLGMALLGPVAATAQEAPTLADLGRDAALTKAFETMAQTSELPDWLRQGMVTSPTQNAGFDGKSWLVMSGCKPHDCASHGIAVIYSPESGAMHGVLSDTSEDGSEQALRWLNIGGGAESIDGRTILFAALTGSLANHPDAFDYD